jgi:8-oxo-dGTP pyrophosphatase MutT (NUDIX family)
MSLLWHIKRCNDWQADRHLPLFLKDARIGWVRRANAQHLRRFPEVFQVGEDRVLVVAEGDADALTRQVDDALERLTAEGILPKWRYEEFPVLRRWGEKPLFRIDRGAVPFLGIRAYGVHVNGRRGDRLWIGRRAPDKKVAPNKLDNLVAGGISAAHGLEETLFKEAKEEADLDHALVERAIPVGAVTYRLEHEVGTRDDVLFLYDLEVPEGVTPRNTDGEIVEFALRDAHEVIDQVRRTDDFKFNVNLVLIDFALRHGIVGLRDSEYLDLVTGLRRPLD